MAASLLDRHWFACYEYSSNCLYIHSQNSFVKHIRSGYDGSKLFLDNPLHGFQANQQSPFTSPHRTV
eukprot:2756973-Ditylum_brightwellii.AAC.2